MKNYFLLLFLAFNFGSYAQISSDSLMAYYPFDGDVLDYGVNNFDGILTGGTFAEDQDGNPNSALRLDGMDDFVNLSELATYYRDNLGQISIFFKVKFEKTITNQTILSLGNSGEGLSTNVFEIEYENDQFQVESETGNAAVNHELKIDESNFLLDDGWHDILILLNGDSLTYCRNNELVYQGLYTPSESTSTNLFLGCFGGTSSQPCCFFGGYIDELQFYNRLITKKELISVSNTELFPTQLFDYYPNPTNNSVRVNLDQFYSSLKVQLIGLKGELIFIKELAGINEFDIELPETKGIYFLEIFDQASKRKMSTLKIIKQ